MIYKNNLTLELTYLSEPCISEQWRSALSSYSFINRQIVASIIKLVNPDRTVLQDDVKEINTPQILICSLVTWLFK